MNSAGLPGTGLGGLFYILLALWMPLAELPRSLRGDSSGTRWRQIGSQFAMAWGIIAAVAVTAAGYLRVAGAAVPFGSAGPTVVLAPVVLAAVLLAVLVMVLRTWAVWERYRSRA